VAVSAKTGENVAAVLEGIVKHLPAPTGSPEKPLRALIFDAVYDSYQGVIAFIRVFDGAHRSPATR
jgi:GTP-binding protein LepA